MHIKNSAAYSFLKYTQALKGSLGEAVGGRFRLNTIAFSIGVSAEC